MKTRKPSLRSEEERNKLALDNAKLVGHVVHALWHVPAVRNMSRDDALQAGWLGLLRACELFDPSKGFRPSTYLTMSIRRKILGEALRDKKYYTRILYDDQFLAERQAAGDHYADSESLREACDRLPEQYRRAVEDRMRGITFKEAAARDGVSPEASRQRFQSAMRVLKSSLSG